MSALPFPAGGRESALRLLPPRIRYAGGARGGQSLRTEGEGTGWRERDPNTWIFDEGVLCFEARLQQESPPAGGAGVRLRISATAKSDVRIGVCAFAMELTSAKAPLFLDRFYRWRPVDRDAVVNDFGQFVVRWESPGGGTTDLRALRGSVAGLLSWRDGKARVELFLDAAALHPRWQFTEAGKTSTAGVPWAGVRTLDLSFAVSHGEPGMAGPPPVAGRFPGGAEAGFALTDHCDFDDEDLLRAFLHGDDRGGGWLKQGLRMTKGVFMLPSSPPPPHPVPALDNARYRELVKELRNDGSEIVPHALSERGTVPPAEFRAALKEFVREWAPATWIDHGKSIRYCYTMGGAEDPHYRLLDALREHGIRVLWSYHDTPVHGSAGLNLLAAPQLQRTSMGVRLTAHLLRGEFLIALHYGRSLVTGALGGRWGEVAAQMMSAARGVVTGVAGGTGRLREELGRARRRVTQSVRRTSGSRAGLHEEPYTRKELLELGAVVFPERAVPLREAEETELLLFTTMEAVHTKDMYSPRAVDRLIRERGLHVGHTYLMNRLPYIAGIFEKGTNRLADAWRGFVGHLAAAVASGRLWNPPAGDLAGWIRDRERITVARSGAAEVRLDNPLSSPVRAFTLLLPHDTTPSGVRWSGQSPSGWRQWGDWLAVWGDLPAGSTIAVRWGERE